MSSQKSSPAIYLKTKTLPSLETTEKKSSPFRLEDEKSDTIRLSEVNLKRLRAESQQVEEGTDLLGDTESASSRVMSESQLRSIVKLLSSARGKNTVLKKTLLLLKKHNTLLENENKLLKERVVGAQLQTHKLEKLLEKKESEMDEERSQRKTQTQHLKETLESIQLQNGQLNTQHTAKIDALLAQIDSKNKRMKDYKRESLSLKEEVGHLKGAMERLRTEVELSEAMRSGMSQIISVAHRDLKVFCRADDNLNFPELDLGVNPNQLHILDIEDPDSQELATHRCYFDRLFTALSPNKEIFPHTKEFLKSMVKGDQACFLFLNNELDQATSPGSIIALTFQYLMAQIENFSNLGNQMKILFRVCPQGKASLSESGGFRGVSGIRRASAQRPRKISDLLKEERSADSFDQDREELSVPGNTNYIDQYLLKFEESWTQVSKFKDISEKVAEFLKEEDEQHKGYLAYQLRIKSDTDDYLGIFRVLTIMEIRGARLLQKEEQLVQSQKSAGKLGHPASLLSFDKPENLQNSQMQAKSIIMPARLLKVISEIVNRNEHAGDLQESLTEGKSLLILNVHSSQDLELASMTGALMNA